MKTYAIATIPGDGIGKEVIPAGQQVLQVLATTSGNFDFSFEHFGWGGDWYCEHPVAAPRASSPVPGLPRSGKRRLNFLSSLTTSPWP